MLAVVCHGKQDLRVEALPLRALGADEVRVSVAFGGICGSDLHYYHRGAVGDFAVREPLVLGHEISGHIVELGSAVSGLTVSGKAALNPSKPCLQCSYCRDGRSNLCNNMYFLGSAGRFPHVQGGFSQQLILRADQIIPVAETTDLLALSVAEPLSVGLHAVKRAGNVFGKRVLVTGSGPIGLLTAKAALLAGATEVVCTDIEDHPLRVAREQIGVHRTHNIAREPTALDPYAASGGYFDVALEASGSREALQSLFACLKRGGRIVQLGMLPSGATPLPINLLQTRELELVGAFRAHDEFALAVQMLVAGAVDVSPILSGTFGLAAARDAFEQAGDRSRNVKLHLALG